MPNESPYECPDETDQDYDQKVHDLIQGAFVAAQPIKRGEAQSFIWLKLSSINTIEPIYDNNGKNTSFCYFKTYKDCTYLTGMFSYELRKAIDTFLFKPDEHWEQYSYD
jgi:hypothetical protein